MYISGHFEHRISVLDRVSSDLENLENLEMSGNLKMGRTSQEKVREFLENSESKGKVREFFWDIEFQAKFLTFLIAL